MHRYGLKNSTPHVKGMVFAGCSFTWGQGLHYYNNVSHLPYDDHVNRFKYEFINPHDYEFIKLNRFANLVASHFNTYSFVRPQNGGCSDATLTWWDITETYSHNPSLNRYLESNSCSLLSDNISHFVLQCTEWTRAHIKNEKFQEFTKDETIKNTDFMHLVKNYKNHLDAYLKHTNQTFDDLCQEVKNNDIFLYKKMLQKFENLGIKTIIMTWVDDLVPCIEKDPWLSDRFIHFNYQNNTYKSIESLMNNHPHMMIIQDYEMFETPPQDHHPSFLAHKIIANSIIEKIESNK
jgi:hypothetical protein